MHREASLFFIRFVDREKRGPAYFRYVLNSIVLDKFRRRYRLRYDK